jgi:hypothetical protein
MRSRRSNRAASVQVTGGVRQVEASDRTNAAVSGLVIAAMSNAWPV